jgi:hypothetical protein
MVSHLLSVLLARVISPKLSAFMAHLKATTFPTPPAPMIRVFLDIKDSCEKLRYLLGEVIFYHK